MKASEFVKQYCEKAGWTEKAFYESQVPMPDSSSPSGWAAVTNSPTHIKAHVDLHMGMPLAAAAIEPVYQVFSFKHWRDVSKDVFEAQTKDGCPGRILYTAAPTPVDSHSPLDPKKHTKLNWVEQWTSFKVDYLVWCLVNLAADEATRNDEECLYELVNIGRSIAELELRSLRRSALRYAWVRGDIESPLDEGDVYMWDKRGQKYEECGQHISGDDLDAYIDSILEPAPAPAKDAE